MIQAKISKSSVGKENIKGQCYLGNSLFSSAHSGQFLESMIEWINNDTDFDYVLVGLSDTLNRYSVQNENNISTADAYNVCLKKGDEWVENNEHIIKKLNKPFKFVRWDYWFTKHAEEINLYKQFYGNLYNSDPVMRAHLHSDINAFCKRRYGTSILHLSPQQMQLNQNYLIEELAVYSAIFKDIGSCTMVYPANQLKIIKAVRTGEVQGIPNTIDNTDFIKLFLQEVDENHPIAA